MLDLHNLRARCSNSFIGYEPPLAFVWLSAVQSFLSSKRFSSGADVEETIYCGPGSCAFAKGIRLAHQQHNDLPRLVGFKESPAVTYPYVL